MASLTSGRVALTSKSVAYQLNASNRRVRRVRIQADRGNSSGIVAVGGSATSAVTTSLSQEGITLNSGTVFELTHVKPSEVWLMGSADNLSVSFLVEND